jgi:bifunctional UDP-N-acetylglucosamine pyrophosphorylase/glucosamine-1-phosphate N-acetyltransferase
MQALPHLDDAVPTLILYGDVPLTRADTLRRLVEAAGTERLGLLTVDLEQPDGYGRIVRGTLNDSNRPSDDGRGPVLRIVEHKDADAAVRAIREVNTGIMVAPTLLLRRWLGALSNDNAQREYYLTDVVAMAVAEGVPVAAVQPRAEWETLGVNSPAQLAALERVFQRNLADELLEAGVSLADPARIDVRGTLVAGRDCRIDVNCVFEGTVVLGDRVQVGANCVLRDATIGAGTELLPMCHVDGAVVGADARIGPFARLRPGADLGDDTHVGNFVEIKNTRLGDHSKANHLAYVGDAIVGQRVNIGAGTITCNYDGANKHVTVIEDDAFIGSDTQLVAPVTVGRGATLGAGTTLVRDAPAGQLTVSRARQASIPGWKRPVKIPKTPKE